MAKRIVWLCISVVVWIFDSITLLIKKLFGFNVYPRLIILYYHSISVLEQAKFSRQLEIILKHTEPVSLDLEFDNPNRKSLVSITFDDGYQSIFDSAIPELVERRIPSTVFIPTSYLGQEPDWINHRKTRKERGKIVSSQFLRDLDNDLITIGSHTVTHPDLTLLTEKEAVNELIQSKKHLESLLNKKVNFFSFPHGLFNQTLIRLCQKAEYKRIFTIDPFVYKSIDNPQFVYGRVLVEPNDWLLEFRLKIVGAYRWLPFAFKIKRMIKKVLKM
jgi:peptidoglycan/xylan/chitin deacetylase (PgdA/CDA1 family)